MSLGEKIRARLRQRFPKMDTAPRKLVVAHGKENRTYRDFELYLATTEVSSTDEVSS